MKTPATTYKLYKPTKNKTGSALQVNPSATYNNIFLEITSQDKNYEGDDRGQQFDWSTKIVMKLGTNDILSIINALNIVRTAQYKELLAAGTDFDAYMENLAKPGKGKLVALFHFDQNKGTNCVLEIKPNAQKYGGGFTLQISKQFSKDQTVRHQININTVEALGILYVFERALMDSIAEPFTSSRTERVESAD